MDHQTGKPRWRVNRCCDAAMRSYLHIVSSVARLLITDTMP